LTKKVRVDVSLELKSRLAARCAKVADQQEEAADLVALRSELFSRLQAILHDGSSGP